MSSNGWEGFLRSEKEKDYYKKLWSMIQKDIDQWGQDRIFPQKDNVFRAFDLCPLEKTRVVIIGQDPYPNQNQANGLAFAVNKDVKIPPSLRNIFKEVSSNDPRNNHDQKENDQKENDQKEND